MSRAVATLLIAALLVPPGIARAADPPVAAPTPAPTEPPVEAAREQARELKNRGDEWYRPHISTAGRLLGEVTAGTALEKPLAPVLAAIREMKR